jgi:hypothetical protein
VYFTTLEVMGPLEAAETYLDTTEITLENFFGEVPDEKLFVWTDGISFWLWNEKKTVKIISPTELDISDTPKYFGNTNNTKRVCVHNNSHLSITLGKTKVLLSSVLEAYKEAKNGTGHFVSQVTYCSVSKTVAKTAEKTSSEQ